ncbi:MAG: poly(3-hydroxybutyrate) depolymerase [Candidatus Krumholzibacteriia bacterium]|jgi:poly(3-hydroxybutyrate) depolymerase
MTIVRTLILLAGVTMLLLACTQETPDENGSGIVELAKQSDEAMLVFSSLQFDQTNRGTIKINGYDRHFSVTFPTSYDKSKAYPVVLFFHGCMCRPSHTEEIIKGYLDWNPRLESYKDGFITIKMSAFSEKKPETPQDVDEGGARGMWFWHKGFESERDDYAFVDTLLTKLLSSSDINIDPENIFGVGHSSGAIFLLSYVLGGPIDLTNVSINDAYAFKAIAVTGGSTFRKGIVDFKEDTPGTLPSVLHIQGEQDGGLWFNGQETGKSGINFLEFATPSPATIIDGLRDQVHGLVYSAWDENTPSNPSTLQKWAEHLGLEYSGYEEYSQYYLYNFAPVTTSEKLLVGMRIKDCGHSLTVDQIQSDFLRVFSQQNGDFSKYDSVISRDTAMTLC